MPVNSITGDFHHQLMRLLILCYVLDVYGTMRGALWLGGNKRAYSRRLG